MTLHSLLSTTCKNIWLSLNVKSVRQVFVDIFQNMYVKKVLFGSIRISSWSGKAKSTKVSVNSFRFLHVVAYGTLKHRMLNLNVARKIACEAIDRLVQWALAAQIRHQFYKGQALGTHSREGPTFNA